MRKNKIWTSKQNVTFSLCWRICSLKCHDFMWLLIWIKSARIINNQLLFQLEFCVLLRTEFLNLCVTDRYVLFRWNLQADWSQIWMHHLIDQSDKALESLRKDILDDDMQLVIQISLWVCKHHQKHKCDRYYIFG